MIPKVSLMALLLISAVNSSCFAQEKIETAGHSISEKYNTAVEYFRNKDYKNAHNIFGEILKNEPAPYNALIYFNMGICLQLMGIDERENGDKELSQTLFSQAMVYYQKVQELLPNFPQLYSNAGLVAYYQNQPDKVVNEMTAAGQDLTGKWGAFPGDVEGAVYSYHSYEALLSIAVNYLALGEYSQAVDMLKDLVSQMEINRPQKDYLYYTAQNSLALGFYNLDDKKGAINSMEASVKDAPSQPKADVSFANLGMLYFEEGEYSKAKESIAKALAINPENQTALEYQIKVEAAEN